MEEDIQSYINKRIEKRNEILENDIDEKQTNQFIGVIVSIIVFTSGAATVTLAPTIGLVIASVSAAVACLKVRNCLKLDGKENRLNKEINHLKKLKNGIKEDSNLKDKNAIKLISLDHSKQEAKEEYAKAKRITFLTYGLTVIGVGATIINPALSVIVIPGIAANILAVRNEINKYNACEDIRREICDINHDLDILGLQEGYIVKEEKELNKKQESKKNKKEYNKTQEETKVIDTIEKPKEYIKK